MRPADPLVVDLDAMLVTAHSEKERADRTWKKGFGFHPLWAFADHGADGSGEPLAVLLRPGNAGANTAADHVTVATSALAQLPCVAHRPPTGGAEAGLLELQVGAGWTWPWRAMWVSLRSWATRRRSRG
ncbi:hypothetical protein FAIPA1_210107 [Frankia sp. AiPs1]